GAHWHALWGYVEHPDAAACAGSGAAWGKPVSATEPTGNGAGILGGECMGDGALCGNVERRQSRGGFAADAVGGRLEGLAARTGGWPLDGWGCGGGAGAARRVTSIQRRPAA